MPTETIWKRAQWGGVKASVVVLATIGLTAIAVGVPAYVLGQHYENKEFLPNYRAPNDVEASIQIAWDYASKSMEANDVIFLGDSSCRLDFNVDQFQSLTGLTAYNLGNTGWIDIGAELILLRLYLQHHAKPQLVIFTVTPETFGLSQQDLLDAENKLRKRFHGCFGPSDEQDRPITDSFSFGFCREGIQIAYGYAMGGKERFIKAPINGWGNKTYMDFQSEVSAQRGSQIIPTLRTNDKARLGWKNTRPFRIVSGPDEATHALARFTQEQGITLVIRLAPVSSDEPGKDFSDLPPFLKCLEDQYSNVRICRPEILWFDPALCFDRVHLNRMGADKFTAQVADEIRGLLTMP